ncbi:1-acyl-sn-glycerol-3-phosphate acyltransferase [Persicimonas caeni]|uniref:1-acyl-sn-glycerol-3-phosphate acyltransferase n=1 Tax=Persicimonas caeni TaxID=2292766 RepID=A0A4Y6Q194_PERCE|nr:lysophospholipid acyltransferase family protein [Persicimonas caeni]QDG54282.1 1-acyl-sn-glycerol-3-phosphate acyltransferase [Persicimonas caeni]QED35503.1 1-acyl-sn-glycerol-3-phosphate acyltransferase [Persicimonas caeni]
MKPQYLFHWLAHRAGWNLCWLGAKLRWKLQYEYDEPFPQDGPVLLLSNHTSVFDPVWVAWGGWRPMHYMASQQLFRFKAFGALIGSLGAFPKIKNMHDPEANATLERLYRDGRPIVLFPEGARTWDGRLGKLRPGIGRLIKRLNARVVTARVTTGHLHRPRWAPHRRHVPVHVRYSAPRTFPPEMSAHEITAAIADAIRIDPGEIRAPEGSWGERLAEGLPDYLWACPSCFALEALSVHHTDRDCIMCGECDARWRVDVHNRMHPIGGRAQETAVHRAAMALEAHFGNPPVADPEAFEKEGVVLQSPNMQIGAVPRGSRQLEPVAHGPATLYEDRLECHSPGRQPWTLPLDEVKAVSVEVQSVLQVRTQDRLYQLEPQGESNIKWSHFLRPWNRLARGKELGVKSRSVHR